MSATAPRRLFSSVLRATGALALALAPLHLAFEGLPRLAVDTAHAGSSHGNGGNGNGNGNGNGGNSGSSGGSNSGSAGGSNSGNGGNNGDSEGNGNSGGDSQGSAAAGGTTHVNPTTGDWVQINRHRITVVHTNGMKEEIENGRFEMTDAQGRTIIERKATHSDLTRLQRL